MEMWLERNALAFKSLFEVFLQRLRCEEEIFGRHWTVHFRKMNSALHGSTAWNSEVP